VDGIPLPLTRKRPLPRADSANVLRGFPESADVREPCRTVEFLLGREDGIEESLIFCRLYSGSVIFSVCILSWMPNESRSVMRYAYAAARGSP